MGKRIILFDIDETLFDVWKFKDKIEQILADRLKQTKKTIADLDKLYWAEGGTVKSFPKKFIDFISKRFSVNSKDLLDITFGNSEIYNECLYDDICNTLRILKKNYVLGIYTEGDIDFQRKKIYYTGLSKFIDLRYIFIASDKWTREILSSLPEKATIVDDRLDKLLSINIDKYEFELIWINRKNKKRDKKVKTINSLKKLLD